MKLAEAYGFCWGVVRAVQIAYEARKQFPDEKIWITNEIIRNPTVSKRLEEMEATDILIKDGEKQFDIVDTTCSWVSKVWNSVEKHKKGDYTSIIHGKCSHEET
ncbi:hypothetical protein LXL04_007243 [Taraxacum kok-saghyz]